MEDTHVEVTSWKPGPRFGGLLLGFLVLAFGLVWLGNELKWWNLAFPLWPVVIMLFGIYIVSASARNILRK